ncbi:sensor domain-containing diguanylate cyclase [Pseudoalteromonas spongiae]|uniref:sensor domain-containing diguanylate cyclase n=1 Tax=Pseudoalteromonas spongiae TaxID=298657 RepID=UPI000C2D2F38|nr:sensor domain-containing diguanylate cyclase [Pseudoalteromonas spongiae]
MYQDVAVNHLPIITSPQELGGFNFSPDIIWVFDLDRHGFWWGNDHALNFWGLSDVQQLIDKDLSADTEGARKRTEQTFVKAAQEGLTNDPWTTYPNGEPKVMLMRHVAVLLGPEKHRGIIAFISEQMDATSQPENLLFAEAMRYTTVAVSCYDMQGKRLFENPAFTQWYSTIKQDTISDFELRFANPNEGKKRIIDSQQHKAGCQEHIMLTKLGERRHNVDIRISRHPLTGDYVFLVTEYDITELHDTIEELKHTKNELKKIAHFDPLTKLPSVWLTKERLANALKQAKRNESLLAVMFIDLDGFKQVNDSYGHSSGDELLKQVAIRLKNTFRESDTVGRLGGDEFLICLPNLANKQDAVKLAEKAITEIAKDYQIKDADGQSNKVYISASLGIAYYPDSSDTLEALIRSADEKMYQAKRAGKNRFSY